MFSWKNNEKALFSSLLQGEVVSQYIFLFKKKCVFTLPLTNTDKSKKKKKTDGYKFLQFLFNFYPKSWETSATSGWWPQTWVRNIHCDSMLIIQMYKII